MYVRNNANTCQDMFEQEKWIEDYSTLCDLSSLTSITLPSRMASPISINNADNGNLINAIHGNFSSRESFYCPELDGQTIKHVWIPRHITLSENSGLITAENCVQLGSVQDEGEFELLESLQTNGMPVSQVEKKKKRSQIVKKTSMAPKGSQCTRGPDHSTAQNMNTKELIKSYRIPCPSGSKDRHSKVMTSRGPRDRRLRLSLETAIKFFNVQDRLGFDQPSRAVEWLIEKCQSSIDKLPEISTSESITNHCSKEELLMNSSASMTSAPKRSTSTKSTSMGLHNKTREAKKPKTFTRRSGLGQRKSSPHRGEALSSYDTIAFGSSSQRVNEGLEAIGRYLMNMEAHDLTSTIGGMQKQLHSNNNIFLDQRSQTSLDESTNNCNELNLGFSYNNAHLQSSPLIEAHYYPCQQKGSSVLLTGSFTGLNSTTFPVSSCPIPAQLLQSLTTDLQSTTTKF